jgi:hypothetical protein
METTDPNLKYKIRAAIGAILLFLGLVWYVNHQLQALKRQEDLTNQALVEMKELKDGVVRSQAQVVTRDDLEKFAKSHDINLKPIEDDLAKLNAEVRGISRAIAQTPGYQGSNLPSSSQKPREGIKPALPEVICSDGTSMTCPNQDVYGYLSQTQIRSLSEPFSDGIQVPIGQTEFRAWEKEPWSVSVLPRKYSMTTVIGQDENGRHYTYNKFSIETDGKSYPIKINDAKLVEELPDAEFRFSPRLYLGAGVGAHVAPLLQAEVIPSLNVALFSYGQTKVNPDWTFLSLGVGFESQAQDVAVQITPVTYNVGKHLPLVDNLHIGPSLATDTAGSVVITGGLFVGL